MSNLCECGGTGLVTIPGRVIPEPCQNCDPPAKDYEWRVVHVHDGWQTSYCTDAYDYPLTRITAEAGAKHDRELYPDQKIVVQKREVIPWRDTDL